MTLAFSTGELFTMGDATITLGGTSLLERVGTVLQGFRYQSVEVAGHTDNQPVRNDFRRSFRDNLELSEHGPNMQVKHWLTADLMSIESKQLGMRIRNLSRPMTPKKAGIRTDEWKS